MIRRFLHQFFGKPDLPEIPEALWQASLAGLPFLSQLNAADLEKLHSLTQQFLAEKEFTTTGGLELNDSMCLTISIQACVPILNLGLEWYSGWVGIVVHPDEFVIQRSIEDENGIVHEYEEIASGEAWSGGPVLVSWRDVQMAGDCYNVVIHEFVHKLDMLNGEVDGIPPLHANMSLDLWKTTLQGAYDDFCKQVEVSDSTNHMLTIDPYAAEDAGEFFAVIAESFFASPQVVFDAYPELYKQLTLFFRTDPLGKKW